MSIAEVGSGRTAYIPPVRRYEEPEQKNPQLEEQTRRREDHAATVDIQHARQPQRPEQVERARAHDDHHARTVHRAVTERRVDIRA